MLMVKLTWIGAIEGVDKNVNEDWTRRLQPRSYAGS